VRAKRGRQSGPVCTSGSWPQMAVLTSGVQRAERLCARVGDWRVTHVVRGREVWVLRVVQKGRKTTGEALS
jgi:hypothetical protein